MSDPLLWHRLQFAFTIVFHYLFPQLTMGLALLIVVMKTAGLRTGDSRWHDAARFWIRIFGVNFAVGVVTGIPMEFQFGTNWANFSRYAGGVVGHTLAMEGLFAFFLESSFLGLLVFGERRLGPRGHFLAALALFAGSWLSGYFIIATNAFMQHPVGHVVAADGTLQLDDFWAFLLNPWALAQYAHNMVASVVTASFVVAAVGAYYALERLHVDYAARFLRLGVVAGLVSSVLVAFPTGDQQAKLVARHQPVALAAMEGHFESETGAGIVMIGQPNVKERRLDNPIVIPGFLSFLAYGTFHSNVKGLNEFPEDQWPDNIELLYYAFHIMAGLGTLFILVMGIASLLLLRGTLTRSRAMLWTLMLAFPFPYIATTTGWMTAELGRQPWLVYGLMRTAEGASPTVHSGTALFTLIGFTGLYFILGVLFLFLIGREIAHGPQPLEPGPEAGPHGAVEASRG
jgi:cytochrome d ubiquinol oxidase subunit I